MASPAPFSFPITFRILTNGCTALTSRTAYRWWFLINFKRMRKTNLYPFLSSGDMASRMVSSDAPWCLLQNPDCFIKESSPQSQFPLLPNLNLTWCPSWFPFKKHWRQMHDSGQSPQVSQWTMSLVPAIHDFWHVPFGMSLLKISTFLVKDVVSGISGCLRWTSVPIKAFKTSIVSNNNADDSCFISKSCSSAYFAVSKSSKSSLAISNLNFLTRIDNCQVGARYFDNTGWWRCLNALGVVQNVSPMIVKHTQRRRTVLRHVEWQMR